MDRLALIGVSHRRGGMRAIEQWRAHHDALPLSAYLDLGFTEAARLSTCNRCDLLVVLPRELPLNAARAVLAPREGAAGYAFPGEAAVEQVARVAASLDSLNPGEDQVMNQVRDAHDAAEAAGTLGALTRFALTAGIRVAKAVRREVELAPLNTSLFSLARPEMEHHLPAEATVAVIGAGEMGLLCARQIVDRPRTRLLIANRTLARAEAVVRELGGRGEAVALDRLLDEPGGIHGLVTAVSAGMLVDRHTLGRMPSLSVVVDLGIPRNVDTDAARAMGLAVYDVEGLEEAGRRRRQRIEENLARAEERLIALVDEQIGEWIERQLGPAIVSLKRRYAEDIRDLVPAGEEAERLAKRFARVPIKGLRALVREYGLSAAHTFLEAVDR